MGADSSYVLWCLSCTCNQGGHITRTVAPSSTMTLVSMVSSLNSLDCEAESRMDRPALSEAFQIHNWRQDPSASPHRYVLIMIHLPLINMIVLLSVLLAAGQVEDESVKKAGVAFFLNGVLQGGMAIDCFVGAELRGCVEVCSGGRVQLAHVDADIRTRMRDQLELEGRSKVFEPDQVQARSSTGAVAYHSS